MWLGRGCSRMILFMSGCWRVWPKPRPAKPRNWPHRSFESDRQPVRFIKNLFIRVALHHHTGWESRGVIGVDECERGSQIFWHFELNSFQSNLVCKILANIQVWTFEWFAANPLISRPVPCRWIVTLMIDNLKPNNTFQWPVSCNRLADLQLSTTR